MPSLFGAIQLWIIYIKRRDFRILLLGFLANNFDYINHRGLEILKILNIMNVYQRVVYFNLILMFKCIYGLAPDYLSNQIIMSNEVSERYTRFNGLNNVYIPFPRRDDFKNSFLYRAGRLWNNMPNNFKEIMSLFTFKLHLKHYVFTNFWFMFFLNVIFISYLILLLSGPIVKQHFCLNCYP